MKIKPLPVILIIVILIAIFVFYQKCSDLPEHFFVIQSNASSDLNEMEKKAATYEFKKMKPFIFPPNENSKYYTINFGPFYDNDEVQQFKNNNTFSGRVFLKKYPRKKMYYFYLSPGISKIIDGPGTWVILFLLIFLIVFYKIAKFKAKRHKEWVKQNTWVVWR